MIRNDHSAARATKIGTNDASRTSGSTASHRRRSIASRLTIWFLAISLVPCALLTTVTARIAVHALENSVRTRLVQIAAAKADEILNQLRLKRVHLKDELYEILKQA